MKGVVKRLLAVLLSSVIAAGTCGTAISSKVKAEYKDPLDIMYGDELMYFLFEYCNRERATLYFGEYGNDYGVADWSIVGVNGTGVCRDNNAGCVTLLEKHLVEENSYSMYSENVTYQESHLEAHCQDDFILADFEESAISSRLIQDGDITQDYKFWGLTMTEASGLSLKLRHPQSIDGRINPDAWWTRTEVSGSSNMLYIMRDGQIEERESTRYAGMLAACNIDISKVAFLTSAGQKREYLTGLQTVCRPEEYDWKMIFFDEENQSFSASMPNTTIPLAGKSTISYSGAYTGEGCGVFGVMTNEEGECMSYGMIADGSSGSGTIEFSLPDELEEGNYVFKVYSCRYNEGTASECCTNIVDIPVTVKEIIEIPGPVSNLKAEMAGKNKVTLTWDEYEGVEGYLIYSEKAGIYQYTGMVQKGKPTTFTDKKALDTEASKYWVLAYVKDRTGHMYLRDVDPQEAPDISCKGGCPAVTGLKATAQTGKVKLSWNASTDAEGYLVYGIRPGASYGYIGMTTQGTTFTDTKASKTDWNFYWVFPYYKDGDKMIVGGTPKYVYGRAR